MPIGRRDARPPRDADHPREVAIRPHVSPRVAARGRLAPAAPRACAARGHRTSRPPRAKSARTLGASTALTPATAATLPPDFMESGSAAQHDRQRLRGPSALTIAPRGTSSVSSDGRKSDRRSGRRAVVRFVLQREAPESSARRSVVRRYMHQHVPRGRIVKGSSAKTRPLTIRSRGTIRRSRRTTE